MSSRFTSHFILVRGRRALAALVAGAALLASPALLAQLTASGPIGTDTRWAITDSPVRVTGNVVVEGGATLSIDPGVRVEFATDTSLTVRAGALYAVGTPSSRIVFTSTRVAAQAQPGDWKGVSFEPGTIAASSAIDHAVVEFGSGIDLRGASPTLRNLALRNNEGPAISIDTASSPIGESLSAAGNGLNGILVASGVIAGDVIWGLRGIPYVVASGTVEVGSLGFGLVPERLRLVPGVRGSLELSLPSAVPAGGLAVTLSSSVPSAVRAPSSISVAEGATRVAIEIEALALGTSIITASRAGFEPARAEVEVVAAPALQLPASLTLNPGEARTLTLGLSERAPDTGLEIALSNSAPAAMSAPAVVRVAPRARSAQFEVRGVAAGQSRLQATARGWGAASSDVLVRGRSLILPTQIAVRPGRSKEVTVSVSQSVEGQPLEVTLATSQSGILGLPATATIAVGQSSVVVQAQGQAAGSVQVTATAAGYESATAPALVQTLALSWDVPRISDAGSPTPVAYTPQGFTNAARLRLSRAAPVGGVRVRLRSANTSLVAWPIGEVVIPEGQTQAPALVRFSGVAQGLTELIAESDDADEARQVVRVGTPLTLRLNNGNPATTLGVGMAARPDVMLESGGRNVTLLEAVTLNFTSAAPQQVEVVGTSFVSAIGQSAPGPLVTGRTQTGSAVAVSSQIAGTSISSQLNVSVAVPQVAIWGLDGQRARGQSRDEFQVQLRVPGSNAAIQWLVEPLDAQVSVVDASPEGIVEGIFSSESGGPSVAQVRIDAGQSSSRRVYVGTPLVAGSYRVRAAVPTVGSIDSDLQRVVVPTLSFGRARGAIAMGSRTTPGSIRVERRINGQLSEPGQPVAITLEVSDPSKATVSASFTLPPGRSSMEIEVTGLDVTSDDVVIRATAPFHDSSPMRLRVVTPTLSISGLDGQRVVGGPRDWFQVAVVGVDPDAIPAALISPRTLALSIAAASPSGVVTGFFDRFSATGGSPVSSVVIPAGSSAVAAHVGEGQRSGTYRVRVESPGAISAESAEQRVSAMELVFSVSEVTVGKGTRLPSTLHIERRQDGILINAPTAVTVALANPSPDVLEMPASVTIPAFASRVEVPLAGRSIAGPVEIVASALGMPGVARTRVVVVQPRLEIRGLDDVRQLTSSPDYFEIELVVGDSTSWQYVVATEVVEVEVGVVEASPSGVVPAIVSTDGVSISRLTIPVGGNRSNGAYVGRPTSSGHYRVRATAAGFAASTSERQNVVSGRIVFEQSSVKVGVGFVETVRVTFADDSGNPLYNNAEVTVSLTCANPSVCAVTPTVVIPPSCPGECNFGALVEVQGLSAGESELRASAEGFGAGSTYVYGRTPKAVLSYYLPGTIGPGDPEPGFDIELCIPGDRAFGEDEGCLPLSQRLAVDYTIDVVSSVPNAVGIVTPTLPGKVVIRAGQRFSEWMTLSLPTPRIPVRATITASAPGVLPDSREVTVE